MSHILIINLKRYGDIYTTAHLINSINKENPHAKISLLVFEEFQRAAKNLKGIKNIYTIDREKILALKQNALFSDGFALNLFYEQIQELEETSWDRVVNYSNETMGAYIASYLNSASTSITGISYSEENLASSNNDWGIVFNDVLTSYKHTPIHFVDCYHRMLGTIYSKSGDKLLTNAKYNESAFKNLNHLRQSQSQGGEEVKIVAIQLKASSPEKSLDFETLKELIQLYVNDERYCPILLLAPIEEERVFATKLNAEFNNTLILAESDFQALASVLYNVDILITPDTATKHVADLTETPSLEISLGAAPFLKQGSFNPESLILTPQVPDRVFSEKIVKNNKRYIEVDQRIQAQDIYFSTEFVGASSFTAQVSFSPGITLYRPTPDKLGIRYTAIAGDYQTEEELSRLMSRYSLAKLFNLERDISILAEALTFNDKEIQKWINNEKISITEITKDILGSLRPLLQFQEDKRKGVDFAKSLEKLLGYCQSNWLIAIPMLIFRAKLEALNNNDISKNIKEIEALLYNLKDNIQKTFQCLKELEQANTESIGAKDQASFNEPQLSI